MLMLLEKADFEKAYPGRDAGGFIAVIADDVPALPAPEPGQPGNKPFGGFKIVGVNILTYVIGEKKKERVIGIVNLVKHFGIRYKPAFGQAQNKGAQVGHRAQVSEFLRQGKMNPFTVEEAGRFF
jgi:hypothetical protein